jgi:dTDP-4-amino-4,6-dideoxygalactose transaminase
MIPFVEKKTVNWKFVKKLLTISGEQNKWTNFGPISLKLEQFIHYKLGLPNNLKVIMCASGTIALHALVNMHNYIQNKELRWKVSSFGFATTIEGPLSNATVVDCDSDGFLKSGNSSATVATNVFGLRKQMNYTHGLTLIDSAAAFDSVHQENEIISFHHTKPWGFGEGGCAIIENKHEELFRRIINFGLMADGSTKYATNGKISDIACAFILQHLAKVDTLRVIYNEQYSRIVEIASKYGFVPLAGVLNYKGLAPNVPLLAKFPIQNINNNLITIQKYYRPLAELPVAQDLFSRIINVPCHTALTKCNDTLINTFFKEIVKNNYNKA